MMLFVKQQKCLLPVLIAVLAAAMTVKAQSSELCSPCEGGVDPNMSFDGVPCDHWLSVAGSAPATSAQCAFDRMVGVWFCGCEAPQVDEICTLCADGSTDYNGTKTFPDSNITCQDVSSVPAIDGEKTCQELSQMANYCECPMSANTCELCPNGEDPAHADRTFLTTGETCEEIMDILAITPSSNCNQYLPELMVDAAAYCGCPGLEAPNSCSLCPAGTNITDKDKPIIYVPGSTCGDFETFAAYITDFSLCDYMHEVISMECCEGMQPAEEDSAQVGNCTFCPDGEAVAFPERELLGINITCSELASREGTTGCDSLYDTEYDLLLDTGIYCGCPEVEPTGVCDFCPPGHTLMYPDKAINDGVAVANATCEMYAALADSTYDDTFCDALKSIGQVNQCCAPIETGETGAVVPEEGEFDEDRCHLCPGGAMVLEGQKMFLGTSVTCENYHEELSAMPTGDECDTIFDEFDVTFNPQIYCGCPDAEPTGKCGLCPEGSSVVDPTIWIADIFTTCGQMEDVAMATSDEEFCSSLQRVGEYYCCYSSSLLDPTGGGKRHLRNKPEKVADIIMPPHHQRQYHFAALTAFEGVTHKVAKLVDKSSSSGDADKQ